MTPAEMESLNPLAGGLNCALAERYVRYKDVVDSQGAVLQGTRAIMAAEIGAAIMQIVASEKRGTFEVQLTQTEEDVKYNGIPCVRLRWRVDLWKARQRQYLVVRVKRATEAMLPTTTSSPSPELDENCVPVDCPHCGERHAYPGFALGTLPRKTAMACTSCTLPIWLMLEEKP